jgi:phospholipid-transporting ATPase
MHEELDKESPVHRTVIVHGPQIAEFCNNSIKTSKYEAWNFLPKFLMEEFNPYVKIANCYFLVVSGLQCITAISNTNGYPTVLIPLTTVLMISGVFKALEDIARHKADNFANSSLTQQFDKSTKTFKTVPWSALVVGDIVKVKTRETIPADLVILQVSEPTPDAKGLLYVETKSLDGETNLKMRHVLPAVLGKVSC